MRQEDIVTVATKFEHAASLAESFDNRRIVVKDLIAIGLRGEEGFEDRRRQPFGVEWLDS